LRILLAYGKIMHAEFGRGNFSGMPTGKE